MKVTEYSECIYKNPAFSVEERVEDLLERMTVEELVAQTVSIGGATSFESEEEKDKVIRTGQIQNEALKELLKSGMGSFQLPGKELGSIESAIYRNILQKYVIENTRLSIPVLSQEEGLNGHLAKGSAMFPKPIGLASSFDVELLEQVYSVIGTEIRARGGHQVFTPVLDIGRDPRWGRFEETYGEDTYLTSQLAKAAVKGLQGSDHGVADGHIIASPKHFAGYGQCDGGRNFAPTVIPLRMLYDEILPPFQAAVEEAGALGIMPSHSEIDGVPCHGNPWLLRDVLRNQWGFKGIVVSDYNDVSRLNILHHVTGSMEEAAVAGLKAGVDMDLPIGSAYLTLVETAQNNKDVLELLKEAVGRILTLKFQLGLFENPYVDPEYAGVLVNCAEHKNIARKAAQKSIVLLKNEDNILPLSPESTKTIAVIGPNADPVEFSYYSARPNIGVSILDGVRNALPDAEIIYEQGCRITRKVQVMETELDVEARNPVLYTAEEEAESINKAVEAAKKADTVVLCIGGSPSTSREAVTLEKHYGDNADLDIPGCQKELMRRILETGKKVIVVLINGKPFSCEYVYENAAAVLEGWYLGEETGNAVADILFGKVNPSAKLPVTIVRNVGHLPGYYGQKGTGFLKGYLFEVNKPHFCFGYGLSYTTYQYKNVRLEKDCIKLGETVSAMVDVTNTGSMAGEEIVQLYLSDEEASVTRPVQELKGFQRVFLMPGETKTVRFTITPKEMSFTGIDYKKVQEPGITYVRIGCNADEYQEVVLNVEA